eukprot:TRINITY_DN7479_c0_g2_i1.p1 TRINITY_DN7479_c0_g2~~TRINITY_DN7479_c0_g2_i1.p1  ORF type:complete len:561 (+),score=95.99 TRINITY_DN7479_c0_g2_i1:396-2078(+)
MAGDSSDSNSRELDQTPTWAVATVVAVIIIISIVLEKALHKFGQWFTERRKKALFEALEKVKAELMVLGFISLLLTFCQSYIAKICIPLKAAHSMLPCSEVEATKETDRRRLLWEDFIPDSGLQRRFLAGAGSAPKCATGKVPLVSTNGLHQLHIFIFFLAVFHVLFSALTMTLGRLKIRGWKEWEKETRSIDYEFSNDPTRFRFAHETSFVRQHASVWNRIPVLFYVVSFFRQFFWSVRKADYLAMRHGFIVVHLAPGTEFDFQKYIKRALEDDFKVVVGISPILWASAVIFLLLNVHGWQFLFWISITPLIIVLAVGTKLQAIITKMAIEIQERHAVVQGIPLVQVGDKYFWFCRPKLLLFLIHFVLFQNAFQITYFLWIWYEFGLHSCFHENLPLLIARVVLGVVVQFLCSYITLPLYALVSQMGSHMKRSIFDEQTSRALKKWHDTVKKKKHGRSAHSPAVTPGASPGASPMHHHLHRFKTTGHSASQSRRSYISDQDVSDMEGDEPHLSQTAVLISNAENNGSEFESREEQHVDEHRNDEDFSFSKAAVSVEKTT